MLKELWLLNVLMHTCNPSSGRLKQENLKFEASLERKDGREGRREGGRKDGRLGNKCCLNALLLGL
jgi:hypothetical protein